MIPSELNIPTGVAVDGAGNVYVADGGFTGGKHAIKKWTASTGQVTTLMSFDHIVEGFAVDHSGNVYVADSANDAILKWSAATQQITTLVSFVVANRIALDAAGNVYFVDRNAGVVRRWNASTGQIVTLIGLPLFFPSGLAVDAAGNVYVADTYHNAIAKWDASLQQVTGPRVDGLYRPESVAVDTSGNVYIVDRRQEIKVWIAAAQQGKKLLIPEVIFPWDIAVDVNWGRWFGRHESSHIRRAGLACAPPRSLPAARSSSLRATSLK